MRKSIEDSAAAMRRIIADLRPRVLDDLGIIAAVKALLHNLAARTGLEVEFVGQGDLDSIADVTKTALYRMLQECLTNVTRHAGATTVDVTLRADDSNIEMTVVDNGRGFAPQAQFERGSFGLFGLGERAGQLGGAVVVDSAPGKGTRVVVRLPRATPDDVLWRKGAA
jgi:two-component system, NarL family, sensor histidine kinase UhpB